MSLVRRSLVDRLPDDDYEYAERASERATEEVDVRRPVVDIGTSGRKIEEPRARHRASALLAFIAVSDLNKFK